MIWRHNIRRTFCILLLVIFVKSSGALSQQLNFKNYSSRNGLPSNEVYDVMQDENGIMWFATDRGLCKYDGYEFVTLEPKDGIPGVAVQKFFPQKNGDIWCTTISNNLFWFNPSDYVIHQYEHNDLLSEASLGRTSVDLVLNNDGSVQLSYKDGCLYSRISKNGKLLKQIDCVSQKDYCGFVLELGREESFSYLNYMCDSDPKQLPDCILVPSQNMRGNVARDFGQIQIVSISGEMNTSSINLYKDGKFVQELDRDRKVIGLGRLDEDHFYIGYRYGGVEIFNDDFELVESFLGDESVSSLVLDHEGGVWFSTISSGVYYLPNKRISYVELEATPSVKALTNQKGESFFVCLKNGNNYQYVNGRFELVENTRRLFGVNWVQYYPSIDCVVRTENNTLKCGRMNLMPELFIRNISDDLNENPLLVTINGFLELSNEKGYERYMVDARVHDVCKLNQTYFLGLDNGIHVYNPTTETVRKVFGEYIDSRVSDIDHFRNNQLVVATLGDGVVFIRDKEVQKISKGEGLVGSLVSEVYIQNDSTVWACTNRGLNRILFNGDGYSISTMTQRDGLVDNNVTDVEVLGDTVWVSTKGGLCSFPIGEINVNEKDRLFLKILDTKANGTSLSDLTDLAYWQNRIEINFRAISFRESSRLNYRYKMVGLENKWTYTTNRDVVFESMPPGSYTFYVQAGANGDWGDDIAKFHIEIAPPFYAMMWFKLIVVFAIGLIAYLFFRFRILSYNRDITRELLRQLLKLLSRKTYAFTVREKGKDVKINSADVLYVKSSGNYLEIHTEHARHIIRGKLSGFFDIVPDSIEYVQVRRSYIIRIDKVEAKGVNSITIKGEEIKVGETYLKVLREIPL